MVVADARGEIIAVYSVDLDGKPLPETAQLLGRDVSNDSEFMEAVSGRVKDGASFVEDLHRVSLMAVVMAVVYGPTDGADFAMSDASSSAIFPNRAASLAGTATGCHTGHVEIESHSFPRPDLAPRLVDELRSCLGNFSGKQTSLRLSTRSPSPWRTQPRSSAS